jgi:hypothetical protein
MTTHNFSTAEMMGAATGSVESCRKIAMRALSACRSALGLFQRWACKRRIFLCGNIVKMIDCGALCTGWPPRIVAAGSRNLFPGLARRHFDLSGADPRIHTGNTSSDNRDRRDATTTIKASFRPSH